MPNQNQTSTTTGAPAVYDQSSGQVATTTATLNSVADLPPLPQEEATGQPQGASQEEPQTEVAEGPEGDRTMREVMEKIADAHNILIALSKEASADELATAIGLTLFLDRLGKRATAIYSGAVPNALGFLSPAEVFEKDAEILQDFVISLNKEKADHLRYRLEGDFVRIFVTPYRTRISEKDLDFTYGDYNVDLAVALNVVGAVDYDPALKEHGKIMRDATVINITNHAPGKLGGIEWSDEGASSVAEMVARMIYAGLGDATLTKDEATALLAGVMAATRRFSNASTTPEAMRVGSMLLESGANQQLVSRNIVENMLDNKFFVFSDRDRQKTEEGVSVKEGDAEAGEKQVADLPALEIDHSADYKPRTLEAEKKTKKSKARKKGGDEKQPTEQKVDENDNEEQNDAEKKNEDNGGLLSDLKAAEESFVSESKDVKTEVRPEVGLASELPPVSMGGGMAGGAMVGGALSGVPGGALSGEAPVMPNGVPMVGPVPAFVPPDAMQPVDFSEPQPEKVVAPSDSFVAGEDENASTRYGQMLTEALTEDNNAGNVSPMGGATGSVAGGAVNVSGAPMDGAAVSNPAMAAAPGVSTGAEVSGLPEMNYMPPAEGVAPSTAEGAILPPPPVPPVNVAPAGAAFQIPGQG